MRYFTAIIIPIGLMVTVFSLLAILTSMADGWSPASQQFLVGIVIWWAHYWWMVAMVVGSLCLIAAVIHDAHAPAKRKTR